jgi:2,3-bisphosphoglycerate-dependent phosphoglycerate mutase
MPRLVAALVRHAEYQQLPDTPSAHQPFPLTDRGREQARRAVEGLQQVAKENGWRVAEELHSSQLLRAWESASIIAEHLEGTHTVSTFAELAERSVGSAANLTIRQIEEIVETDPRFDPLPEDWKSNSHFCLPLQGAESLMQAGERVAGYLEKAMLQLAEQVSEDTVKVFVGHGAAIRHAACFLGVLDFEEIARLSMYHAEPVYIEYSETGWKHVAGNWKIRNQAVELD